MNASELSNQALAKLLYSRKNLPLPKVPESLSNTFKPSSGIGRSRNNGAQSFGQLGGAG